MKRIIALCFLVILINGLLFSRSAYQKNDHVIYNAAKTSENYIIDYTFMDHVGELNEIQLQYPINKTNKDIKQFGIPKSMLGRYKIAPGVEEERARILKEGMFKLRNNTIFIDLSAVSNYYAPAYCKPIADILINKLREKGLDTRYHRIEMALKFVQDIPYAIPSNYDDKKFTGGAFCPPEVLIEGYGDCDSKTMLYVGILSYMINPGDIIFVGVKNHMLAAIKSKMIPGGVYFKYKKENYFIAEAAGPGRQAFGEQGKDYKKGARIEPFTFAYEVNTPPTLNKETVMTVANRYYYVRVENHCNRSARFIIRYKNIKGDWVYSDWEELEKKKISKVFVTQTRYFYLYAYSGNIIWKGKDSFMYNDKKYEFNKVGITNEQSGDYTIGLRCK